MSLRARTRQVSVPNGVRVNDDGECVDARGRVVPREQCVDESGQRVDDHGRRVDEQGVPIEE